MWPFSRKPIHRTLGARVSQQEGRTVVDVSGQTCPGYLLSINRAVDPLPKGTPVTVATNYAPCGADVEAWCRGKGFSYEETRIEAGRWLIRLTT